MPGYRFAGSISPSMTVGEASSSDRVQVCLVLLGVVLPRGGRVRGRPQRRPGAFVDAARTHHSAVREASRINHCCLLFCRAPALDLLAAHHTHRNTAAAPETGSLLSPTSPFIGQPAGGHYFGSLPS